MKSFADWTEEISNREVKDETIKDLGKTTFDEWIKHQPYTIQEYLLEEEGISTTAAFNEWLKHTTVEMQNYILGDEEADKFRKDNNFYIEDDSLLCKSDDEDSKTEMFKDLRRRIFGVWNDNYGHIKPEDIGESTNTLAVFVNGIFLGEFGSMCIVEDAEMKSFYIRFDDLAHMTNEGRDYLEKLEGDEIVHFIIHDFLHKKMIYFQESRHNIACMYVTLDTPGIYDCFRLKISNGLTIEDLK